MNEQPENLALDAIKSRLETLEDWAEIDHTAPANDGTPDSVNERIEAGMSIVARDAERRMDALAARLDALEQRLSTQETARPC